METTTVEIIQIVMLGTILGCIWVLIPFIVRTYAKVTILLDKHH